MADTTNTDTTRTVPTDRRAVETTHINHNTGRSAGNGMAFILGGVVVVLAILAFFVFAGDEDVQQASQDGVTIDQTAEPDTGVAGASGSADGASVDTTEVIEPGAADGGVDQPVTTEPNEAGTSADPALGGDTSTGN